MTSIVIRSIYFGLLLLGAALLWQFYDSRDQSLEQTENPLKEQSSDEVVSKTQGQSPVNPSNYKKAISNSSWKEFRSDQKEIEIKSYPNPSDDAVLLDISKLREQPTEIGDSLSFHFPQTLQSMGVVISKREEKFAGVVNIKSEPDSSLNNYVIITLGAEHTFGNFFTPQGEFQLIGTRDVGWLVPASALRGPTEDDYLLPPPEPDLESVEQNISFHADPKVEEVEI